MVRCNGDAFKTVDYAIKNYKDDNNNQVWCVFDIDHTHEENRLEEALQKAKENNIRCAYSNIAFEVWLISHYEKCSKNMNNNELTIEINKLLKKKYKKTYDKNNETLLKEFFIPYYKTACVNSKYVYQNWNKDNNYNISPIWEWNSSTNIHLLIEALKLNKK